MTTPEGTYISSIVFINYLPAKLPQSEEIRAAGTTFKSKGDKIDTGYSDTITHWNKLAAAATYPNDDTVNNGFATEIRPLAEAVVSGINSIKAATDTFAESLDGFKSTHSNLKTEVENFNALPHSTYSDAQKEEAGEEGTTLPATRTSAERSRIIGLLQTAKESYQSYIDTCASAIDASSPAAATPSTGKATVKVIKGFKNTYNMVNTNVDRAAKLDVTKGGRLKLVWSMNERSLSQFAFDGAPNLKKFLVDGKLGPFTASEFMTRHADEFAKWADGKFVDFTTGANTWTDSVLKPGFMLMLPAAVRNKLSNVFGRNQGRWGKGNKQLFWESNKHGKTKFKMHLTGEGPRARFDKFFKGVDKFDGVLDKINKSPITKWGGRGLGLLDTGMTYYDSYTSNYNEELRNNPGADPDEIRNEAAKSTAIEGTAETAGKIAGGVAGRALGAAAGQALIPIPGVGAAVGGFVGGLAGEWVGGKIGKGVGEFMNDWRQGGASKAFGDAGEAIGDAGKAVGEGLKDIGKGIGEKLFGWG
ncbi:hypothetical protein [Arthrobacter sp. JSM 101049]|uniref:hypothetical protein n=1 Tax=Arthrobacter sp. JSM 101049 TaxID=929097 RepID=UPI0035644995